MAAWTKLSQTLLARTDEHWSVWIDWYEAILHGRRPWPLLNADQEEALSVGIALIDDAIWKQGPAAANAEVARLVAEAHARILPEQTKGAASFAADQGGVLHLTPPSPEDRLTDTPALRDLYADCREKADDLRAYGAQVLGESLCRAVDKFLAAAPEDFARALERRVWSALNSLRGVLNGHDAIARDRAHDGVGHPAKLDPGAAEKLRDFVETGNQLAFEDPKLRARDERRPGPREHDLTKAELALGLPLVRAATDAEGVADAAAKAEVRDQVEFADRAGDDLAGKQTKQQARDTHRNFFAAMLAAVSRHVRGEGGFVSKEFVGGFYKAGGAAVFAGVYYRNETLDFIMTHLEAFASYCELAYAHSPGAQALIRALIDAAANCGVVF